MELKMQFNKIKYIGPRVLKDNLNLWHIDLSYNKIKYIASDLFRPTARNPIERVRRLNLAGNQLVRVPRKLFKPLDLLQGIARKNKADLIFNIKA